MPDLLPEILRAERELRQYLNDPKQSKLRRCGIPWPRVFDSVRVKNLQKAAALLNQLADAVSTPWRPTEKVSSREPVVLDMLAGISQESLPEHSKDNAWELADKIERELVHWMDAQRLVVLLKGRKDTDWHPLATGTLIGKIKDAPRDVDEDELRIVVERMLSEEHQGFRRERARMRLRKQYLMAMSVCLPLLVIGTAASYAKARRVVEPYARVAPGEAAKPAWTPDDASRYTTYLLILAVFAGATGSVLARGRTMNSGAETPGDTSKSAALGIRQLMYHWWTFFAQPVLGATTGLIGLLVFHSGLIKLEGLWKEPIGYGPAVYAILAFLSGFSEPFFIGVVDRVSGLVSKSKG